MSDFLVVYFLKILGVSFCLFVRVGGLGEVTHAVMHFMEGG